jgi:hypothetical protein
VEKILTNQKDSMCLFRTLYSTTCFKQVFNSDVLLVCKAMQMETVCFSETLAMPWLRWLAAGISLWRPGFMPGSVHAEFVVGKVALG